MSHPNNEPSESSFSATEVDADFKAILVFGSHSGQVIPLQSPVPPWIQMLGGDDGKRAELYILHQQDQMCAIYRVEGTPPRQFFEVYINRLEDADYVFVDDGVNSIITRCPRESNPG